MTYDELKATEPRPDESGPCRRCLDAEAAAEANPDVLTRDVACPCGGFHAVPVTTDDGDAVLRDVARPTGAAFWAFIDAFDRWAAASGAGLVDLADMYILDVYDARRRLAEETDRIEAIVPTPKRGAP